MSQPQDSVPTTPHRYHVEYEFQRHQVENRLYVHPDAYGHILYWMRQYWDLQTPNLLISFTGDAENFKEQQHLTEVFMKGLMKAAESTGAWFITNGQHAGATKFVGEAFHDYIITHDRKSKVKMIGFGSSFSQTDTEDTSPDHSNPMYSLDPNHSFFILNDGGKEKELRRRVEDAVIDEQKEGDMRFGRCVTNVTLVLGGDYETLKTVAENVGKRGPVVIFKDSGGTADILDYAISSPQPGELHEALKQKMKAHWSNIENIDWDEAVKSVESCLNNIDHITVLSSNDQQNDDMELTFMRAFIKGLEPGKKLMLTLNRLDIAETELFAGDVKYQSGEFDEAMKQALLLGNHDVVKVLFDNDVKLGTFPTNRDLKELYNERKVVSSPLRARMYRRDGVDLWEVYFWTWGVSHDLFQHYEGNETDTDRKSGIGELFMWSLVIGDAELSLIFWCQLNYRIAASFVAQNVLHMMQEEAYNSEDKKKLQEMEKVYADLSVGVLDAYLTTTTNEDTGIEAPRKIDIKKISNGLIDMKKIYFITKPGEFGEVMKHALLARNHDVVKVLFDNDVKLGAFPTKDDMEDLYNERKMVSFPLRDLMYSDGKRVVMAEVYKWTKEVTNGLFRPSLENETDTDRNRGIGKLFMWSLLIGDAELSLIFWCQLNDGVTAALAAQNVLHKMQEEITGYSEVKKNLEEEEKEYGDRAVDVLDACLKKDARWGYYWLKVKHGDTSIELAKKVDNSQFIRAFHPIIERFWYGLIKKNQDNFIAKMWLCIYFPFLFPFIGPIDQRERRYHIKHFCRSFKYFFKIPAIIFIYSCLAYIPFLALFSVVVLTDFHSGVSKKEIALMIWVFTLFVEEIRQLAHYKASRCYGRLFLYISDPWNKLDMVAIALFVVGTVLRFVPNSASCLESARMALAFSLMAFFLRILHMFSVSRKLGPKLVMIGRMIYSPNDGDGKGSETIP